jgi:hypothetical protein
MRQLRLFALFTSAVPALLLVPVVACEDSSSGSSAPFTFEAGPGFEAGPPPEAGPLPADDAGVDAADVFVPPAPKGVTVTVFDSLLPKANVRVISHDATGGVIGDTKTDATGKVTIAAAPSMVTVLATRFGSPSPVTFFAVADGDNLSVQIPPIPPDVAATQHYSVTFTPGIQGQSTQAQVYVGGNSCGNSTGDTSTPLLVDVYPECLRATNAILGDGSNSDGTRDGYSFLKNVAAPAANSTSNVTLSAWAAPGTVTLKATNLPGGSISNTGELWMIANGASFIAPSLPGNSGIGGAGVAFQTATGFADAYQSYVNTVDDESGRVESSIVRREAVPVGANATLPDVDFTNALPYITATSISTLAGRPTVTLTSDQPLTGTDGGVVVLSALNSSENDVAWTFVLPASAAAMFKAPALPTDPDAITFTPSGNADIDSVAFFEATQIPSYKETKLIPVVPRVTLGLLDPSTPLPINGTVRITTWAPQPQ